MKSNSYKDSFSINPEIDFKDAHAAENITESLINNRFAIIENHGVSLESLNDLYTKWGKFFANNKKYEWLRTDEYDEGYVPTNTEKAVGHDNADWKEYYQTHWNGSYPDYIDCKSTKTLVKEIVHLGEKIITSIDSAMPQTYKKYIKMSLTEMIKDCDKHGFRVIHYPGMQEVFIPPRAGAHTDICFLTILPNATADGLEIQDNNGIWHVPKLNKDSILVFAGDMLEMATNGYIGAGMHRVTATAELVRNTSRFSFPIFIHPRREVELQAGITAIDALRTRITEIGFDGSLLKY
jgi:isopenicillin N synthase-like dioxygenase